MYRLTDEEICKIICVITFDCCNAEDRKHCQEFKHFKRGYDYATQKLIDSGDVYVKVNRVCGNCRGVGSVDGITICGNCDGRCSCLAYIPLSEVLKETE